MTEKNKTCSYCEFYDPFLSEIFDGYMIWGDCDVDAWDDPDNYDPSKSKKIKRGSKAEICERFEVREDVDVTYFMKRCGVL